MTNDNKETKGDRISFYIFPPGQSFPWVRVYEHPCGIRGKQVEIDGFNVTKGADPDKVAMALGRMIIKHSDILQEELPWMVPSEQPVPDFLHKLQQTMLMDRQSPSFLQKVRETISHEIAEPSPTGASFALSVTQVPSLTTNPQAS